MSAHRSMENPKKYIKTGLNLLEQDIKCFFGEI